MARHHTGRRKVLSAYRSYHGGTQLAVNMTGDPRRIPNDDDAGVVHFLPAYTYRSYFAPDSQRGSWTEQDESQAALAHLKQVLELERGTSVAAIVLEGIPERLASTRPRRDTWKGCASCAMSTAL